jgi:hypothetical protein
MIDDGNPSRADTMSTRPRFGPGDSEGFGETGAAKSLTLAGDDSLVTGSLNLFHPTKNSDMFIATEQQRGAMSTHSTSARTAVVLGGTSGIGKEIVRSLATQGTTVYLSGRTSKTARAAASEIGLGTVGLAVDLSEPETIADALADIGTVDFLVIPAIERDANTVADYNVARAIRLVTLKLVGYTEAVHALRERFTPDASVVLFGGLAMLRAYPGSTTVSTVNGGVLGLVHSLATWPPCASTPSTPASSATAPSGRARTTLMSSRAPRSAAS